MDERQPGAEPGTPPLTGRPADYRTPPPRRGRIVGWGLLLIVLAFLAGFGWQYYRASTIEARLERTEQELAVERLRVGLAQAAVAAQSGDFEAARQQMSDFFTAMQARLDQLPPDVRAVGANMLRTRDDVITGLSRENPEAADGLYRMLLRFRTSLGDPPPRTDPATLDTLGTPAG
ncbi:MAG TPA: hypothetical protein VMM12_07460 [Longimicrobiales bacterium]|nr:hypothetical protein [Longimicrobiales bacterium]